MVSNSHEQTFVTVKEIKRDSDAQKCQILAILGNFPNV